MRIQKEQLKDLVLKMHHQLAVAFLKFVEAVERMLIKLKLLLRWSKEQGLLVKQNPLRYIENLLKHRKRKQNKDEHESNWGIGGTK